MIVETCRAPGKQDARLVTLDHRDQHRRWPDRPHGRNSGKQSRIGIMRVGARNGVRVGQRCRHIERQPLLCAGKEY